MTFRNLLEKKLLRPNEGDIIEAYDQEWTVHQAIVDAGKLEFFCIRYSAWKVKLDEMYIPQKAITKIIKKA